MEQKSSVVKKASYYMDGNNKKKDNFGNFSLAVEFANGDKGWFTTKYDNNSYFKEGATVNYCLEAKTKKDGGTYYKVTMPKADGAPATTPPAATPAPQPSIPKQSPPKIHEPKAALDMKFEARMYLMQIVVNAFVEGKIDDKKAEWTLKEWTEIADSTIDDLYKG